MQSVKSLLKNSRIGKIVTYIYDSYRFPEMVGFKNKYNNLSKDHVILIGTPTFKNLGDHLIAVSELDFLSKALPEKNVFEIPTHVFLRYKDFITSHAPRECLVVITGGGWMGNLWPKDEYNMQEMIKSFAENTILIMPQTVYYEDNEQSKLIMADAISTYESCENLYMTFRDRASYEFAINSFGVCSEHIRLFPDITLSQPAKEVKKKTGKKILICMRSDLEKTMTVSIPELLQRHKDMSSTLVTESSTITNHRIPIWRRSKEIEKKIDEFSDADLVITDRLHGMIFSILSGTPCIAIDNRTHKVKGVFEEWIKGQFCVEYLNYDFLDEELVRHIQTMLRCEYKEYKNKKTKLSIEEFSQFVRELI